MPDLHVIDPTPVDAAVVDYLEHLLARAREGRYSAIAVAFVYRDGSTGSGYSRQHSLATMVGGVEALKTKLIREMLA